MSSTEKDMNSMDIIERFTTYQRSLNRAASTIDWYRFLIKRFFQYAQDKNIKSLQELEDNNRFIMEYQIYVSQLQRKDSKLYSTGSQNLHIVVLRMLFKYLMMARDMQSNPAEDIELAKEPNRLPRGIISEEEVAMILNGIDINALDGLRDKAIMEILYATGVRRTELLNLDTPDINFDEMTLLIRQGKGKKDRYVAITDVGLHWLKKYLYKARAKREYYKSNNAVFLNRRGLRLGKQGLKGVVTKWAKKSGISKIVTPHSFRHALATHLLNRGASLPIIQRQLGHANLETTALYLHVAIGELKKAHAQFHPRGQMAA